MNNAKRLRKLYKLTQNEIADVIDYAKPLYAAFELEKLPMPKDKLEQLSKYYNVSFEYIIDNDYSKCQESR